MVFIACRISIIFILLQVNFFRENFKKYFFLSFAELVFRLRWTSVWCMDKQVNLLKVDYHMGYMFETFLWKN